jgi:hypothetical protein
MKLKLSQIKRDGNTQARLNLNLQGGTFRPSLEFGSRFRNHTTAVYNQADDGG